MCVAGTRIRVWDIYVQHEIRGMSPDEIAAQYPELSLADVHAAMAYDWDNREAIDKQMYDVSRLGSEQAAIKGSLEMRIRLLPEAEQDLELGADFYESQQAGLGSYFTECLSSDIDSLSIYGGIHE